MTAAAAAPDLQPSPEAIDKLAAEYQALEEKWNAANLNRTEIEMVLDEKAAQIRELVGDHGSVHAQKSKILYGLKHELMVTYSSSTSVDAAAVETFRLALKKASKARLLGRLFQKSIRWDLQPQAGEIVRGSVLSDKLRGLWAKCHIVTPKTPSVKVRERK